MPKVSQETLAEMIGTTRPLVRFFRNRFREHGYIEYGSRIQVNTSLLNVVLDNKTLCRHCFFVLHRTHPFRQLA